MIIAHWVSMVPAYIPMIIETGSRSRTNAVCVNGQATDRQENTAEGCARDPMRWLWQPATTEPVLRG